MLFSFRHVHQDKRFSIQSHRLAVEKTSMDFLSWSQ